MRKETIIKAFKMLKEEGLKSTIEQTKRHIEYHNLVKKTKGIVNTKDILLINGCPIDYCERYRLIHKAEELEAYSISCDIIEAHQLNPDMINHYRGFIIYRFPFNDFMQGFIDLMHEKNKVVFYDLDDLVFDLKYTNTIKELETFTKEQRAEYDDGVIRYGKTLKACDYAITTTSTIANEMKKHVKDVCVDKNIASLEMQEYSELAIKEVERDDDKVIIGYASGSMTHNADLELIAESLKKILDNHPNVYLKLIGVINVPEIFKEYENRILTQPFVEYTKLPKIIRSLDINLAPLEDTFFNKAKSCIKWMEAALVKVPTVASDVGDFHDKIIDGVNGVLCKDNEWYDKLEKLVVDKEYRELVAENAYKEVYNKFTAISSGKTVADFIKKRLTPNICFVLPSANISGGVVVVIKHALMLKQKGYDVVILNTDKETKDVTRLEDNDGYVDVININKNVISILFDTMVATMWSTVAVVLSYSRCRNRMYLVQNKETGFYEPTERYCILNCNKTYDNIEGLKYITISKWCEDWLKKEFGVKSSYVRNGIDLKLFPYKKRTFKGKIKILIEGDSKSFYKNVDESFAITNKLDKEKFEIYYLSYNGQAKEWYQVDKSFNKVSHNEVYKIYQECDILLKTSILESFSYPPLEMMATGGVCVVAPNEGNVEYLKDNYNCLFYEQGNIENAIEKINELANNKELREKLIKNGLKTAQERSWDNIKEEIIKVYEE